MVAAYLEKYMNPKDLLRATRDAYVLVKQPGSKEVDHKCWSIRLHGLHKEALTASVKSFRDHRAQRDPDAKKTKSLKVTALLAALSNALGARSYEEWLDWHQPKLLAFLESHGLRYPTDLIAWPNAPLGRLTAQQVA